MFSTVRKQPQKCILLRAVHFQSNKVFILGTSTLQKCIRGRKASGKYCQNNPEVQCTSDVLQNNLGKFSLIKKF